MKLLRFCHNHLTMMDFLMFCQPLNGSRHIYAPLSMKFARVKMEERGGNIYAADEHAMGGVYILFSATDAITVTLTNGATHHGGENGC